MTAVYDDDEAIRFIAERSGLEDSVVRELHNWFDVYMVGAGIYPIGVLLRLPPAMVAGLPVEDRFKITTTLPRRRATTWDTELLYLMERGFSESDVIAVLEGITAYQVRIGVVDAGVLGAFEAWKAYR